MRTPLQDTTVHVRLPAAEAAAIKKAARDRGTTVSQLIRHAVHQLHGTDLPRKLDTTLPTPATDIATGEPLMVEWTIRQPTARMIAVAAARKAVMNPGVPIRLPDIEGESAVIIGHTVRTADGGTETNLHVLPAAACVTVAHGSDGLRVGIASDPDTEPSVQGKVYAKVLLPALVEALSGSAL